MAGAKSLLLFLVLGMVAEVVNTMRIQQMEMQVETSTAFDELKAVAGSFKARIMNDATSGTFSIKDGKMHNFGVEDCNELTNNNMTCFANNPSSPYGVVMLPPPAGKDEDWSLCGGLWKPLCSRNSKGERVGAPFHMEETEAIVILGVTPPEVKYFGFTNYMYEHTFPDDFEIDSDVMRLKRCWAEGWEGTQKRCDVFASMGDALNHGNLKPNTTGQGVYLQKFAMVITPSRSIFEVMSVALQKSGMSVVNALPLPGEFINHGFGDGTDTVIPLLRTAFPSERKAYDQWLEQQPFIVMRVTPTAFSGAAELYAKPRFCTVGGPGSGGSFCPLSVREEWFKLGLSVLQDKDNGHVYLGCEAGEPSKRQKASCVPEECDGDAWCFVKDGCGGWLNGCKEGPEFKLSCPAPHVTSDYCLTPRSKMTEADRVNITMESLKKAQQFILDKAAKRVQWWSRSSKTFQTEFVAGVPDNGFLCLDRGEKCAGDSRDTYYPASAPMIANALMPGAIRSAIREKFGYDAFTPIEMAEWRKQQSQRADLGDDEEEYMMVVGVVHSATAACEYSSLSIYDLWKLQGIMALPDFQFKGSADDFLAGTEFENLSPYLYAVKFTRGHCNGEAFCVDVPSEGELSIPVTSPVLFIERMYFDPNTHIGISPDAAVAAKVIHIAP